MAEREAIEAPCNPAQYRILKRIASNPDNHLAIGFGGGSAPGLAGNIALAGLLTELEIRPYIKEIWGASAGAIVGGAWSTGAPVEHMLSLLDELDRKGAVDFARWEVLCVGLVRLLLFKQLPEGLVRGRQIRNAIERGLRVERFEDCEIPFRVIACTDDGHAQKIIFRQGPLVNAISASMCIPGIVFPVSDWDNRPYGYFDGAVVEKTPLPSIIEEHHREGRKQQLVVICTHFSDSGHIERPVGFLQRFLNAMQRLEDEVWEYQALKARETSNCKFVILNPHMKEGGAFDFSMVPFNYLWARKMFKEQLSNAKLATRFDAR
ncbi:MAG: patatin-like phospholipase family protein [Pseudomonadota bacterium]|nr:patatin-like phospholipase family protein [Pseudomonadota bacterium]